MPSSVLVLFAHPALRRSRSNRVLRDSAAALDGVTVHDLYEAYPDFAIDVDREQALLAAHDAVVCLHPFFWYSAPAIVKEWLDLVLEHGWAYGHGGDRLAGKRWLQAVTVGARQNAYGPGGHNRFTVEELLRPFEATATLCRMRWLPPFVLHATHVADAGALAAAAADFSRRLVALRDGDGAGGGNRGGSAGAGGSDGGSADAAAAATTAEGPWPRTPI
jgi:glutathione-regulated potassium-efflux system ancillary protein KefG